MLVYRNHFALRRHSYCQSTVQSDQAAGFYIVSNLPCSRADIQQQGISARTPIMKINMRKPPGLRDRCIYAIQNSFYLNIESYIICVPEALLRSRNTDTACIPGKQEVAMKEHLQGLTTEEANNRQIQFGRNEIKVKKQGKWIAKLKHIKAEPIYLLLAGSAIIYFILGEMLDGILMISFVLFVIGIDVLQEARTGNALKKLKDLSEPKIRVIRDGREVMLNSVELVPGDIIMVSEGIIIPADGWLIKANGLYVNESILTGESEAVWKNVKEHVISSDIGSVVSCDDTSDSYYRSDYCYTGTQVILGNGTILIDKTGNSTEYGKIAETLTTTPREVSILQKQLTKLARRLTRYAVVLFFLVNLATFINLKGYPINERIIESLLAGVVLALSMVPGEFPVIQSVFLSMGALRLAKKHALVRSLSAVETLGAVSVLCVDKTGTITKNKMEVVDFWYPDVNDQELCRAIALSCKEDTYDPMEIAMLSYCKTNCSKERVESKCLKACVLTSRQGQLVKEYAFTNELKAMGQVWQFDGESIIAAKGSVETILPLCLLTKERQLMAQAKLEEFARRGLRVIAVGEKHLKREERIPDYLLNCQLHLKGIIAMEDPPRDHIEDQIKACYQAGIRIVMITGDHPETAASIAKGIGIHNSNRIITGKEINILSDVQLRETVKTCNLYARVLPLHKMRIVEALKSNGEVTAMTGDGVNDSPALKIADIGVSMGKHGSEVSREAADLILLDDNIQTILDSVHDGRRIYGNITKAIGYILAVHLPIALISLLAPLLGIAKEALMLLPLHIVLLELVMDPTVSIALERQPAEEDTMVKPPRRTDQELLSLPLLIKSLAQGLMIFVASFFLYYGLLKLGYTAPTARAAGYGILIVANICLVLVNCSDTESFLQIIKKIKHEKGIWLINGITFAALILMIYTPAANLLELAPLPLPLLGIVFALSIISVFWYEVVKCVNRRKCRNKGRSD